MTLLVFDTGSLDKARIKKASVNSYKNLNMMYTNADILTNKLDELNITIKNADFDLVAITEVLPKYSLYPVQAIELSLKGYNMVTNIDDVHECGCRGICIYVKEGISFVRKKYIDFEEFLSVDILLKSGKKIAVGVVYRSPNSSFENNEKLLTLLTNFVSKNCERMIIMGDFNLPRINWVRLQAPSHTFDDQFLNCTLDNFLHQHVMGITRSRAGQVGNTLDLIFTKEEDYVSEVSFSNPLGRSDHLVINISLNEPSNHPEEQKGTKLLLNKGNYLAMRDEFGLKDWVEVFRDENVQTCWGLFRDFILELQLKYIPCVPLRVNSKPLWMGKAAKEAHKNKSRAWKKYWYCRTKSNFENYKSARNKLKTVMKDTRVLFEEKVAVEINERPKSFWSYVRRKTKDTSQVQKVRRPNGELTQSNEETACCLNTYFATVFTADSNEALPVFPKRSVDVLDSVEFEEEAILDILKNLKVDKAPGPDGIQPRVLSELKSGLVTPLRLIFEKSLEEKYVPKDWKEATIVPIFKKGRKDSPDNYRPVSLTSAVCKIMEKVIRDAIMAHLVSMNLLSGEQYGFVPGRSTTLQLLVCMEEWTTQIENGMDVDVIYTDYSKAFDSVSHSKLLHKLDGLGIGQTVLGWLKDFLSGRQQRVRVGESFSHWVEVKSGVPQGSVLGPALFLAFINDLPENITGGNIKLFADDAKIYRSTNSEDDSKVLQHDLDSLVNWSSKWSLNLNPSKCKVLHASKNPRESHQQYSIDTGNQVIQLEKCAFEKDLGVFVDEKLSFETHIGNVVKTANRVTGIIRRQFKYIGHEVFVNLYKSLVRPLVEYSSVVWSPSTIRDQKQIEGVQRRATKLAPKMANMSYNQRLVKLGLPTLEYRRLRADMIQVYKIVHRIDRINPDMFFELSETTRTRGHKYKIKKQRPRTNLKKFSFSHRVVDTWNALPANVVEAQDLNSFKSLLNAAWKHHPVKFSTSFCM